MSGSVRGKTAVNEENQDLVEEILEKELRMFLAVRTVGRAACQEQPEEFRRFRTAQFSVWPADALESYRNDLVAAEHNDTNLMTLKYARMGNQIPCLNEDPIIDRIVEIQYGWQKELFEKYPRVMRRGRPLDSRDNTLGGTSFETYLRGELETYSQETLRCLLRDMEAARQNGVNRNEKVYEALIASYGISSLAAAEAALPEFPR